MAHSTTIPTCLRPDHNGKRGGHLSSPPRDTIDETVSRSARDKRDRVDLGLALLCMIIKPGKQLSRYDIAAWCGCTDAGIYMLERRAMKKLRNKLLFGKSRAVSKELAA